MATLRANGEVLCEIRAERTRTDGADGDPMRLTERRIIRAMSSGYALQRFDVLADYGFGNGPTWHRGAWKRAGKLKAAMMADLNALKTAFGAWADDMRGRGWDAEISF